MVETHDFRHGKVLIGDALDALRGLPDASVQCVVTSPPYWGLRDYGTRRWFGGDPVCTHMDTQETKPHHPGQIEQSKWKDAEAAGKGQTATTVFCKACGAWYGQLGLEVTPQGYVAHLVEVFREVRRVLRIDGTFWLNLGDSYYAKDLVGIPWRVAFALQDDGWWLRSDIIWAKPNVMPESVMDRPTRAHEYIFLLTKAERYFYDHMAVSEPLALTNAQRTTSTYNTAERYGAGNGGNEGLDGLAARMRTGEHTTRNRRSVWTINPRSYFGAHFATFPPKLPEICIKAGTSEKGCCPKCGAPWERILEDRPTLPEMDYEGKLLETDPHSAQRRLIAHVRAAREEGGLHNNPFPIRETVGWKPSCSCGEVETVPCVVLDPFSGSGTTLMVAADLRRRYVGIELNPDYLSLIQGRLSKAEDQAHGRDAYDFMLEHDFHGLP